jgi:large subunit ribosomal protein L21
MKYAIVESGGKQYKAIPGNTIEVDRLQKEVGDQVELDVLLLADGDMVKVGAPIVDGAKVRANVVEEFKAPKVMIFKFRAKKRYRRKLGHRQIYTRLNIEEIVEKKDKKGK